VIDSGDLYILMRSMREDGDVDFTGDGATGADDIFLFAHHWGDSVIAKQERRR